MKNILTLALLFPIAACYSQTTTRLNPKDSILIPTSKQKNYKPINYQQDSTAKTTIHLKCGAPDSSHKKPLFIVDEKTTDSIQDINPNDIISIDILKASAATTLYGVKGANGVIILKTKKK